MPDHDAAESAIADLKNVLDEAVEAVDECTSRLRDAGFDRLASELDCYTHGWISKFADDDEGSYQPGSIGSLLDSLRNNEGS